ncbi:MAG TPA: DoxX family protein [Mucilaginibacter sp.]|nr:DoxX family protein [Mucilaginibacter sp.]
MKKDLRQWGPLFLRIIIGFGFMQHGWAKLSRGPAGFEKLLIYAGVPFHHLASWAVPLIELLGGLAILLGAFVAIISIPLICTMLVAMFTIQLNYGFSSVKTIGLTAAGPVFGPPGYEINLLYIAGLISLMLTGAGLWSIDNLILKRNK